MDSNEVIEMLYNITDDVKAHIAVEEQLDELKSKHKHLRFIWDYLPSKELFICIWNTSAEERGEKYIANNEYATRELKDLGIILSRYSNG